MAPDTAAWHRTAPTDKTQQHTEAAVTTVGLRIATRAGRLNDWLHSSALTINDTGAMGEGKRQRKVAGMGKKKEKLTKIYAKKGVKIGISIKLHNTCCLEILVSSRTQAGLFCPEKKQWLS